MGKKWIRIKETGQLFLERVLVSFDIPILFVCTDYENRRYLCLNIDPETGKSVIALTDSRHLIAMMQNKVTMESVFRDSTDHKIVVAEYDTINDIINSYREEAPIIPVDMLPKKDELFDLTNKEIEDYILFLERNSLSTQNEIECGVKRIKIQNQRNSSFFVFQDMQEIVEDSTEIMIVKDTINKCIYSVNSDKKIIA